MNSKLLGNTSLPNYVKIVATAILALTYLAALGLAVAIYVSEGASAQLPAIVVFILGTGLTMALGTLGLHQGASLLETPPPSQVPQVPQLPQLPQLPSDAGSNAPGGSLVSP